MQHIASNIVQDRTPAAPAAAKPSLIYTKPQRVGPGQPFT